MRKSNTQNYLDKYLEVKVLADKTVINYWNADTLAFTHEHKIGMDKIDAEAVSKFVVSDWVSGFIYALANISLHDRVPKHIYLHTEKHTSIFEKALRDPKTYSQFYLGEGGQDKNIYVIINKISFNNLNANPIKGNFNNNNQSYERYTKAISQFRF